MKEFFNKFKFAIRTTLAVLYTLYFLDASLNIHYLVIQKGLVGELNIMLIWFKAFFLIAGFSLMYSSLYTSFVFALIYLFFIGVTMISS